MKLLRNEILLRRMWINFISSTADCFLFRSVFFSGFGSTKPMLAVLCDTYLLFTKNSDIMNSTNRKLWR